MYQLILKQQRQSQEEMKMSKKSRKARQISKVLINVNKYEPEDFRRIVQFIHCGTVDVNAKTVAGTCIKQSLSLYLDIGYSCFAEKYKFFFSDDNLFLNTQTFVVNDIMTFTFL